MKLQRRVKIEEHFDTEKQLQKHQRNTFWKKVVSVLGCIVVFCTTYALILPAITLENDTVAWHYEDDAMTVDVALPKGTEVPSDARLMVRPITETDDSYEELTRQAGEAVSGEAAGIALYDISFYTQAEEYIPVSDAATVSIQFKESVLAPESDRVEVLHYEEGAELPVTLEEVEVTRGENDELAGVTFQTEGFSIYAVVALSDEEGGISPQADGTSFTLTYNGYKVTFNLMDTDGNALALPEGTKDITADAATKYNFADLAPKIEGYAYKETKSGDISVNSVATGGYADFSIFRLYEADEKTIIPRILI